MKDNRQLGNLGVDLGCRLRPAHVGQVEIHQDDIGLVSQGNIRSFGAGPRDAAHAHVRFALQNPGDRRAEQCVVLYREHAEFDGMNCLGHLRAPIRTKEPSNGGTSIDGPVADSR